MTIAITVFGNENDLNRELSKRGLMREPETSIHSYPAADGDPQRMYCEIIGSYKTTSHKKLKFWFREGLKPHDFTFPKKKNYSNKPGHLESISVL